MKNTILALSFIVVCLSSNAQLNSGTVVVPPNTQPVPNSSVKEKSAPTQTPHVSPPAKPVPPIYPGADVKLVETQTQLINPASAPAPTQPIQKEPISPIESTNRLQPNRPQRDEASRRNPVIGVSENIIPLEKGPISPIESTKRLQPNRSPRDEASRRNPVIGLSEKIKPPVGDLKVLKSNNGSTLDRRMDRNNNLIKPIVKPKKVTSNKAIPTKRLNGKNS